MKKNWMLTGILAVSCVLISLTLVRQMPAAAPSAATANATPTSRPSAAARGQEANAMNTKVQTWPIPFTEMRSKVYAVEVEGVKVPVWLARVREAINSTAGGWTHMLSGPTDWASFARFDAVYPVTVTVKVSTPFATAEILPRSAGVKATVEGNTVRFRMGEPRHLTLLLDDRDEHPLHLFCREMETDVPSPDDPNLIYFGPGEHWVNTITPKSGQTVYLHGGAIVRGTIPEGAPASVGTGVLKLVSFRMKPIVNIAGVENVTVRGRGILDGTCLPHPGTSLISISRSKNIRLEGVMLRNSPGWQLPISQSQDVTVENLACLSGRVNGDGVNCVESTRIRVRRTFVRSQDDSFVVKTMSPDHPAKDIVYEQCVAWNDLGYAFGVSYETRSDISDVTFRDCDVLYGRNWPLGIHVSDGGTIGPIRFERIGVHYPRSSFDPQIGREAIKMEVVKDEWGHDEQRGHIRDVTFRNIDFTGTDVPSMRVRGYDAEHRIENLLFENVQVNGKKLAEMPKSFLATNPFVTGLQVKPGGN